MSNIIQTTKLSKSYHTAVCVKDLDLKVKTGSIYGFLGPNGAGKSTTLKMLLGLTRPTKGEIHIFDQLLTPKNRLSILRDTGSLIESPSYYAHLTGEENLRIFQTLKNVPKSHIDEVLRTVRLENQKHKKVSHYSLGMKQRLGIATALLGQPKLLILDEPTNGLDPAGIQEIRELITTLPKQYGMTVVISSHILNEIDQVADDIGIIHQGELVFQDSLENLHNLNQRQLAIRTLNNPAALKLMASYDLCCTPQDHFLLIPYLADKDLARYMHLLVHNDIDVIRVEERSRSLEDIFLDLTGMAVSL
ncbi:MAG: ABC transporter ATP-binding protein [Cellulosilyticaceae bacterium]